jgi:hypothetical protein
MAEIPNSMGMCPVPKTHGKKILPFKNKNLSKDEYKTLTEQS